MIVKRGDWGNVLVAHLACGHQAELRPEWVHVNGFVGRIQCTQPLCRRITEDLQLEGWEA